MSTVQASRGWLAGGQRLMRGHQLQWVLLLLTVLLLALAVYRTRPGTIVQLGRIPGPPPDAVDYAYGAASLLHGTYTVPTRDGSTEVPRYSPGYSILLMPSVAIGGVAAADRTTAMLAIVLAATAAAIVWRVGVPVAAPLAVVLVLFPPGMLFLARLVMSDLPSATFAVLELLLLTFGGPVPVVLAGVVGGGLPWLRPPTLVLLLAGLAAVSARPDRRRSAALYLLGALPPLLLLGAWQWLTYGSPLKTGYQAGGLSPTGGEGLEAFFDGRFILGPPISGDSRNFDSPPDLSQSNLIFYLLDLLGPTGFMVFPGVGLLGLASLLWLARRNGIGGVVGRFGLAAVALTLMVYAPYFYQGWRFLTIPAALLSLAATILIGRSVQMAWTRWRPPRSGRTT